MRICIIQSFLILSLVIWIEPTSAKDGTYRIWTFDGLDDNSASDANKFITIYGTNSNSTEIPLVNGISKKKGFRRPGVFQYKVRMPNLGQITAVTVRQDGTGNSPDWLLDMVVVQTPTAIKYGFQAETWLSFGQGAKTSITLHGFHVTKYKVLVFTGSYPDAGTDANVFMTIFGQKGATKEVQLIHHVNKAKDLFVRLRKNLFRFFARDVGDQLQKIVLRHDNTGESPDWYVEKVYVDVHDGTKHFEFSAHKWLGLTNGDKKLSAEFPVVPNPFLMDLPTDLTANLTAPCSPRMSLGFLIDGSSSIEFYQKGNFKEVLTFVKRIVAAFNISTEEVNVGAMVYSTSPELIFDFKRYHTRDETIAAIDGIQYPGEESALKWALSAMRLDVLPTARDGLPKIVVVLTDGAQFENVTGAAKSLKDTGATVYAIGLGSHFQINQLRQIATDESHVLTEEFINLNKLLPRILSSICLDAQLTSPAKKDATSLAMLNTTQKFIMDTNHQLPIQRGFLFGKKKAKPKGPEIEYKVYAITGEKSGAGTDSDVFITLYGKNGKSREIELKTPLLVNGFQAGKSDKFKIKITANLGPLTKITLRHRGRDDWFADQVLVKDPQENLWGFAVHRWLKSNAATIPGFRVSKYKVTLTTGSIQRAGTDADVFITLFGPEGQTKEVPLTRSKLVDASILKNLFEKSNVDSFKFYAKSVGNKVTKINIRQNNKGILPAWFIKQVDVNVNKDQQTFTFKTNRWLAVDKADGRLDVTFPEPPKPTTPKPTTQKPTTQKPTTQKPTTQKLTTQKPTTQKPTTQKPTTQKPTSPKPTTQKPTTQKPTTQKPTTHKPTTPKPITTIKTTASTQSTVGPSTAAPLAATQTVSNSVPYTMWVFTGTLFQAGTDANIWVRMIGQQGNTQEMKLVGSANSFEAGSKDKFTPKFTKSVGPISGLTVRHDNAGFRPDWYLEQIFVLTPEKKLFGCPAHRWLGKKRGDNKIAIQIPCVAVDKYEITVLTSSDGMAGTDANVYITLLGPTGGTKEVQLTHSNLADNADKRSVRNLFEQGSDDQFKYFAKDVGDTVDNIRLRHDNGGVFPGWKPEKVKVKKASNGKVFEFPIKRWMDKSEGDGKIDITVPRLDPRIVPIQASTTQKPSTEAATTQKPSTAAPTTQKPSTAAPTTQKPSTAAPTTQKPSTAAPTTQKPSTAAPSIRPGLKAATTHAPTTTSTSKTTETPTDPPACPVNCHGSCWPHCTASCCLGSKIAMPPLLYPESNNLQLSTNYPSAASCPGTCTQQCSNQCPQHCCAPSRMDYGYVSTPLQVIPSYNTKTPCATGDARCNLSLDKELFTGGGQLVFRKSNYGTSNTQKRSKL